MKGGYTDEAPRPGKPESLKVEYGKPENWTLWIGGLFLALGIAITVAWLSNRPLDTVADENRIYEITHSFNGEKYKYKAFKILDIGPGYVYFEEVRPGEKGTFGPWWLMGDMRIETQNHR